MSETKEETRLLVEVIPKLEGEIRALKTIKDAFELEVGFRSKQVEQQQKQLSEQAAEIKRHTELLHRYRICVSCGKQLSEREAKSVHTCFDEQALKDKNPKGGRCRNCAFVRPELNTKGLCQVCEDIDYDGKETK